ncbi:MAG: polysaccharide biosynthesis C-terminal domain-containing protein [Salibacteraceae bacterium]
MFGKILATIGSRFLVNIIQFFLVIATTHFLGDEGKGEVALLVLNITLVIQFTQFIGGPALVYLVPRLDVFKMVISAYTWCVVACSAVSAGLILIELAPSELGWHLLAISLIQSLGVVNQMVLLGRDRVKEYNWLSIMQVGLLIAVFTGLMFLDGPRDLQDYLAALYVANGSMLLLSFWRIAPEWTWTSLRGMGKEIKEMARYGFFAQLGNLAQLLNYRLSFFLLKEWHGVASVGVYSTGIQLSEVFWVISRGISTVQYAHISNSQDENANRRLTLDLLKFSFLSVLALLIPALLLPNAFYTFLFGPEFSQVKSVLYFLAPGVAVFAVSSILSHYFAGVGLLKVNAYSSIIGLGFTLVLGFGLIPSYEIAGAGLTATASYSAATAYQLWFFLRYTGFSIKALLPTREDGQQFVSRLRQFLGSQ